VRECSVCLSSLHESVCQRASSSLYITGHIKRSLQSRRHVHHSDSETKEPVLTVAVKVYTSTRTNSFHRKVKKVKLSCYRPGRVLGVPGG
jgi:hypothetical protein